MLVPPAKDIKKSFKRKNKKIMPCLCKLNYELLKSIKTPKYFNFYLFNHFFFFFANFLLRVFKKKIKTGKFSYFMAELFHAHEKYK